MAAKRNKYCYLRFELEGMTKVGVCPICKERVERIPTDMYFPFCGYKHWRIQERKDEEKFKAKRAKLDEHYEQSEERAKLRSQEFARKMREKKREPINVIRERIEKCKKEVEKHDRLFKIYPKGNPRRKNAIKNRSRWKAKLRIAQFNLEMLEKELGGERDGQS